MADAKTKKDGDQDKGAELAAATESKNLAVRLLVPIANTLNALGLAWLFYRAYAGGLTLSWLSEDVWVALSFMGCSMILALIHWLRAFKTLRLEEISPGSTMVSVDERLNRPFLFLRWFSLSIDRMLSSRSYFRSANLLQRISQVIGEQIYILALMVILMPFVLGDNRISNLVRSLPAGIFLDVVVSFIFMQVFLASVFLLIVWMLIRASTTMSRSP